MVSEAHSEVVRDVTVAVSGRVVTDGGRRTGGGGRRTDGGGQWSADRRRRSAVGGQVAAIVVKDILVYTRADFVLCLILCIFDCLCRIIDYIICYSLLTMWNHNVDVLCSGPQYNRSKLITYRLWFTMYVLMVC